MKLFQTSNLKIIQYCRTFFSLQLPSVLIKTNMRNSLHDCHMLFI